LQPLSVAFAASSARDKVGDSIALSWFAARHLKVEGLVVSAPRDIPVNRHASHRRSYCWRSPRTVETHDRDNDTRGNTSGETNLRRMADAVTTLATRLVDGHTLDHFGPML
jgi:hypothetical protein